MVKIRELEERDVQETNLLHQQIFRQSLAFEDYVKDSDYYYGFVLENEERILGYLVGQIIFELADLYYVAINPQFYGKGYGYQLVKAFIEMVRELGGETISLEVRMSNIAAINLYEKCGFIRAGMRKHYYLDGEDALMMLYTI